MWRTTLDTRISGSPEKVWKALITPSLWKEIDPEHYKEVNYSKTTLTADTDGSMKTQDSPFTFKFHVSKVDSKGRETVTTSKLPGGLLTITKKVVPKGNVAVLSEAVTATGPFAKLFAKLFFEKQIAGTLKDQHDKIKSYASK